MDWVFATLELPFSGGTAKTYLFAESWPGHPPGTPITAFYRRADFAIVMGPGMSAYEARDGFGGDDAPENGEWHEYTHHLHAGYTSPCDGEYTNHGGYWENADTCDSLNEGFAAFLPAVAARTIEGTADAEYASVANLEWNWKAWHVRTGQTESVAAEDLAVAALLWDLWDANEDTEASELVFTDHAATVLRDDEQFSLAEIWQSMQQARTVYGLRRAFHAPPTIDLTGNGGDLARLDDVFLMHGFFPVSSHEVLRCRPGEANCGPIHLEPHHDLAAALLAEPGEPNRVVGLTSHPGAGSIGTPRRENTPALDGVEIEIRAHDASGTPLLGAAVDLAISYPGVPDEQISARRLGAGERVRLELPPYTDALLEPGAPLPPCEPGAENAVTVRVAATLNGFASLDAPTFDSCSYHQAISAAAPGEAPLSLTVTFPEDAAAPESTLLPEADDPAVGEGRTTGGWLVSLACEDPVVEGFASGCWRREYRLDGGPITEYERPFEIRRFGANTVEYRSVDAAGNEEPFRSVALEIVAACGDGLDNDRDGVADAEDPGCPFPEATPENPPCNDGVDNDADGATDADDAMCSASWPYWEAAPCGLGAELVLVLMALGRARRRRARMHSDA